VFTARNVICGILLLAIMWGVKDFVTAGVKSEHGDLFFVCWVGFVLLIAAFIDWRRKRTRGRALPPGY
jgi:drug/metabolite transporter (DMT)-like permease